MAVHAYPPVFIPATSGGLNIFDSWVCRCHIFYSHRVVDIPDGKPKWSKMDGVSQLVDDVGDLKEVESVVSKEKLEKAGRNEQEKDRKERREKATKEGKK